MKGGDGLDKRDNPSPLVALPPDFDPFRIPSPQGAGTNARVCYNPRLAGEMDERFKSHAWKACLGSNLTGVRIPVSPPEMNDKPLNLKEIQRLFVFPTYYLTIK